MKEQNATSKTGPHKGRATDLQQDIYRRAGEIRQCRAPSIPAHGGRNPHSR